MSKIKKIDGFEVPRCCDKCSKPFKSLEGIDNKLVRECLEEVTTCTECLILEIKSDYMHEKLFDTIRERMDKIGVTQSDLSRRLGVSRQHISKILNNKTNLTIKSLIKISDIIGLKSAITLYREI